MLATALSCLLSYEERTALRRAKVSAESVIALFEMHHIRHHALNADDPEVDAWHNLHPMLREDHKARFAQDAAAIAKVKRIRRKDLAAIGVKSITPEMKRADISGIFDGVPVRPRCRRCGGSGVGCCQGSIKVQRTKENAPAKLKSPWRAKRRIPSRPFPTAQRPMRCKKATPPRDINNDVR
jgi:hypothetical protein